MKKMGYDKLAIRAQIINAITQKFFMANKLGDKKH